MLRFEDLYESHAAHVYRFALWLSGDRPTAQDIVSDTFVRAWTRRDAIRTETLRAYLLTIARNLYLEERRKERRHVELLDTHPDPVPGPERQVQARLDLGRVREALHALPEIDRAAFGWKAATWWCGAVRLDWSITGSRRLPMATIP